jgi:hypothetical protein
VTVRKCFFGLTHGWTVVAWRNGRLTAAVDTRRCNRLTVAEALVNKTWIKDITGALTIPAIVQYIYLRARVDTVQLQQGVGDRMVWKWTSSGTYSASSAYEALFHG